LTTLGINGPWSEAQRVWIDNKGPSAPIIEGGSTEYALSRTISVKTEADDSGASGVAYYEYHKKSGSTKPEASAAGTKVTTSATSQKFDTNIAGDYVFFRAIDVVGNKGAWSDGQQLYIDINKPTITVKQASLTITQGKSYNFSDYFTVAANGTNTSYTTTYKVGSTAYTNTSTLAVGTHTVTCTATKTGGNSESATMTVIVNSAKPAYTEKSWTTAGTYTWTAPAGVTRVRVAVCGGGSGGACTYDGEAKSSTGGDSVFGELLTATGGQGNYLYTYLYDDSPYVATLGNAGVPSGNKGDRTVNIYPVEECGGGAGFGLSFIKETGNYGKGGACNGGNQRAGGNSGGYVSDYVNVVPGQMYSIKVGAGGKGANNGYFDWSYANNGNSGFVLIAYGGDI